MTHEIKVTLKETSEALGTWVSEEVNELVFISEVIGQFERRLEEEGLSIVKTVHPTPGDRFKPCAKDDSKRNDSASVQEANSGENTIDNRSEGNLTNISTTNINETVVSSKINNTTPINDNRSNTIVINTSSKNASVLEELKDLITELNTMFMDLDERGRVLHMSSWLRSDDEQNEKEQQFKALKVDFIEKHSKLRRYYLSFSELSEMFDELRSLSHTLTFWYGFKNDKQNHTRIVCDHQIEEYRKCIDAVWEVLSK